MIDLELQIIYLQLRRSTFYFIWKLSYISCILENLSFLFPPNSLVPNIWTFLSILDTIKFLRKFYEMKA